MTNRGEAFEELCRIMHRLRAPGGCPWDREQTHSSLIKYLIEESYEVVDAIEVGNDDELKQELGDLLLQVLFHSEIAEEEGRFAIQDVIEAITAKMVHRHPHVFADSEADTSAEVLRRWEALKREERGKETSFLEGIPGQLPALLKAQRYQSRASQVGFDWTDIGQVFDKVREEILELEKADGSGNAKELEEEFGDLLFALVNWGRFKGIDAEDALQRCNRKFKQRFDHIEKTLNDRGSSLEAAPLDEMDALWEEAKSVTRRR
jgi:tetrapyrrole methylase family protein/MazG family protein